MTLAELEAKMPGLTYGIEVFLTAKRIPYKTPFFGDPTIEDADAAKAIELYQADMEKRREREKQIQAQQQLEQEEAAQKKQEMAKMLITSGFNFDGYRIVKYSGYISGDDAMSVDRGWAWEEISVRDKLMSSLTEIRRNALRELKEAAYALGCNAVIGVDFDYITLDPQTANLAGGTTYQPYVFCVTANGNAVIIEKIED